MTVLTNEEATGTVHFNPKQFGRLSQPVIVLRKVNIAKLQTQPTPTSSTAWELIGKGHVQLHVREERLPWYAQGLIVNDQPRDEKVARDIVKATIGFAIARTDTGEVLKVYGPNDLEKAQTDAKNARMSIKADIVSVVPEDDDDDKLVEDFLANVETDTDETPNAQEA